MTTPSTHSAPIAISAHDRQLVRAMLAMTPVERLRTVAAYWPLVRAAAGGAARP